MAQLFDPFFADPAPLTCLAGSPLPITLGIAGGSVLIALLLVVFLLISVGMILVVLIQKPQGGGLSGAFGAAADGAGQTAMGVKTGDALTTMTIGIFVLFLTFAVLLNYQVRPTQAAPGGQIGAQDTDMNTGGPQSGDAEPSEAARGDDAAASDDTPANGDGAAEAETPADPG